MPIRYEGEDKFVIQRARRTINLIDINRAPITPTNANVTTRFHVLLQELEMLARLSNHSHEVRYALKDVLTVAAVIMDTPPGDENVAGHHRT